MRVASTLKGVESRMCAPRFFLTVSMSLCVAFHLPAVSAQQEGSRRLLVDMWNAMGALDYQGSFVYEHNGQLDALRLFHAAGGPDRERLVSMSGERSEIVRNGTTLTCVQEGMPTQLVSARPGTSLLPLTPKPGSLFSSGYYAVSIAGSDRVAGYPARVVEISARDGFRYGYRLWLDESSHLPLRSALVDGARRTLEQFMFVSLDIGGKPKESDLQMGGDPGLGAQVAETPMPEPARWQVTDLPPGFALAGTQRPAQGPTTAEHHLYTDGVASVSLYVERRDASAAMVPDRAMARGAMHVYARDADDWRITAVGDVPAATVARIARSTQAKATAAPALKPE